VTLSVKNLGGSVKSKSWFSEIEAILKKTPLHMDGATIFLGGA
jgi:hypothetical protein